MPATDAAAQGSAGKVSSSRRPRNKNPVTSLKVFRQFFKRNPDGSLDASRINSKECYEAWLGSRKGNCRRPERFFQRTLTAHISGTDGRTPFQAEEEEAILRWLRVKQRWPCFEQSSVRFGEQGFRSKGFHEKNAEMGVTAAHGYDVEEDQDDDDDDDAEKAEEENGDNENDDDASSSSSSVSGEEGETTKKKRRRRSKKASAIKKATLSSKRKRVRKSESDEDATQAASINTPAYGVSRIVPEAFHIQNVSETLYVRALTDSFTPDSYMFRAEPHALYRTATLGLFNMFSGLQDTAKHWWASTLSWLRMRCLGRGWLPPTMDDAKAALAEFSAMYPGHYVHIFDFTADKGEDRIMLQNEESRRLFGRISRHEGGFSGKRFLPQDTWSIMRACTRAFCYPGMEIPTQLRWILTGQPGLRTAMFVTAFFVDDARRMVLEHGFMVEGTLTS